MQFRMQPIHALMISSLAASSTAMSTKSGEDTAPAKGLTDQPAQDSTDLTVIKTYFKDGLRFETLDKNFTFRLGANIAFDTSFTHTNADYENAFGREEDGARFRLARVSAEGSVNQNVEYKWQYDFAGSVNNKLKDLYLNFPKFCVGSLRVGQFKEPQGLEQLTSDSTTTFMERAGPDRLLSARNIGAMLHDTCPSKRGNWAVGIFREDGSDTGEDTGDGEYAVTARLAGTPMMRDATHLLHLGVSGRHYAAHDSAFRVTYAGETTPSTNAPAMNHNVAALSVNADAVNTAGAEAAWVNGPLSIQGEYVRTAVDQVSDTWIDLDGYYLFASYFLTGESRGYNTATGAFSRVRVAHPFGKDGGMGAWEVGLRYSTLDLNSEAGHSSAPGTVNPQSANDGGRVDSITAGTTWYLNDYTRVMMNYIHIQPDDNQDGTSEADVLAM
ncbi:MAG TPA: porin, partial [Planctomycetota bacterium]|nr:porin [Planctomycetota bacterium]